MLFLGSPVPTALFEPRLSVVRSRTRAREISREGAQAVTGLSLEAGPRAKLVPLSFVLSIA
jgi:hypothetical protein